MTSAAAPIADTAARQPSRKRTAPMLRSAWRVTRERKDVLVASLGINVLSLALPLVVLQVYDRIIPNAAGETLLFLVLGLSVAVGLDFVLRWLRSNVTTWSSARFEHAISKRASGMLMGAKIEAYERTPVSVHLDRLGSIEALREFHSGQAFITASELPFVGIFLGLIWLIGGPIVWAPVAVVGLSVLVAVVIGVKLDAAYRQRSALDDEKYDFLLQVLTGMNTLKVLGAEALTCRRYEHILGRLSGPVERVAFWTAAVHALGPVLGNLGMISVAAGGSVLVLQGNLTGGALVASTLLAGRAVQPVIRMIGFWVQSRNLKIAEDRLNQIAALEQEERGSGTATQAPLEGAIRFDHVTVRPNNGAHPLLCDISVDIRPGEIVALTGASGSGRAALLDLIAGFHNVSEGQLSFDGRDAAALDARWLRSQIGYPRQSAVLYRGTLAENLTMFGSRERLRLALEVAQRLGLDDVLARLPEGLDTPVGDRASEALPRSVQQMIVLARTLSRRPRILLFNEANSALDMAADAKLRGVVEEMKGETTVLMVTSRPSLMAIADRVLRFDRGQVTEVARGGLSDAADLRNVSLLPLTEADAVRATGAAL